MVVAVLQNASAAEIRGGKVWPKPGETEDRAQTNLYVTVFNRSDGSVQVFYHDPDSNKLIQRDVTAGSSLKISYWDMKGKLQTKFIRTPGAAAQGDIAESVETVIPKTATKPPAAKPVESKPITDTQITPSPSPEPIATATSPFATSEPIIPSTTPSSSTATIPSTGPVDASVEPTIPSQSKIAPPAKLPSTEPANANLADAIESSTSSDRKSANTTNPLPEAAPAIPIQSIATSVPVAEPTSTDDSFESTAETTPILPPTPSNSSATNSSPTDISKLPQQTTPVRPGASLQALGIPSLIPQIPEETKVTPTEPVKPNISIPTKPIGENYLPTVNTSLGPCAWKHFPIKVFMPNAPVSYAQQLESDVHAAFDTWSKVTDNKLTFQFVGAAKDANMVLGWTASKKGLLNQSESGEARVEYSTTGSEKRTAKNPGDITHAKITFVLVDLNLKPWGPGELRTVALHEIGHALGLMGHSPNASDIMYFQKNSVSEPSERDVNTVRLLYQTVF